MSNGSATACSSSLERVGRDGFLGLSFKRHGQNTVMSRCRFTLPLQAFAPLHLDDGAAYMLLLNPTGGLVGGDYLSTKILQEKETHVCFGTPSATRVYRTARFPTVQETLIQLGERATLEYLPDHIIPHAGSEFRQHLRVEMGRQSRAILFDALAAGRVARGECWKFKEFDSRTEVSVCGKPVYLNRTKIHPATRRPQQFGVMEGFSYLACLALFAEGFETWPDVAVAMNEKLAGMPQIVGGVTLLSSGGCVVRFLANSAADLTGASAQLWAAARDVVLELPPFDLRKY